MPRCDLKYAFRLVSRVEGLHRWPTPIDNFKPEGRNGVSGPRAASSLSCSVALYVDRSLRWTAVRMTRSLRISYGDTKDKRLAWWCVVHGTVPNTRLFKIKKATM